MNRAIWLSAVSSLLLITCTGKAPGGGSPGAFRPGEIWPDTEGNPINAHGGGVLYQDGVYYWYGEIKSGETRLPVKNKTWTGTRVQAGGVSCYSSTDLVRWNNEGVALPPVADDPGHDLYPGNVIERPKVVYNESTRQYVMWMHIDSEDYSAARAGVAVSDNPVGLFVYRGSIRPDGSMSRDMTLFKDDDGRAYLVYASENNATLHISLLSPDYLSPGGTFIRVFEKRSREAPAVFKYGGRYFIVSSGCTGWDPNEAEYAVADSMLGTWTVRGNPCQGPDRDKTYFSQSTFVLAVADIPGAFIFMADRWDKQNLPDSRYVWLPLRIQGDTLSIAWRDSWDLTAFKE
ncbi:family 43 glycosylhydrolase [bacterium]|nr:family 43 glycosylhydrolase [bacterium]